MTILDINKKFNNSSILAMFIGLAYCVGILNYLHVYPSKRHLNIGLQVAIIVALGLLVIYYQNNYKIKKIGWSILIWSSLFIILLIQPLLTNILYPSSLVFSIMAILFIMILSISVFQIVEKTNFIKILAFFLVVGALLECVTQYAQLFRWSFLYESFHLVLPIKEGERPSGNIMQPNQAAFVHAMGIVSSLFLIDQFRATTNKITPILVILSISILILASGISISASRGGIVLGIFAMLCYHLVSHKSHLKSKAVIFILGIVGYFIGTLLLDAFSIMQTAIERVAGSAETHSLRVFQQQQAWVVFQDNPITGIGWGNFPASVLSHFNQLNWISTTDHSHFIVSQIASELGILGLIIFIPFICLIIKNFSFSLEAEKAYVLAILGLFTLYSFSEYPLWYFNFLMLFATFLSLIDIDLKELQVNIKKIFVVLVSFSIIISIYYHQNYMKYARVFVIADSANISSDRQIEMIANLNTPYGFVQYKEYMLYNALPVSSSHLEQKLNIGYRVSNLFPAPLLLQKQGLLYGLVGREDLTLKYFKVACLFNFSLECNEVQESFYSAYQSQPDYFKNSYQQFILWREQNPEKTGLSMTKEVN